MIKALIVDDESIVRHVLCGRDWPVFLRSRVVGEAENGEDALHKIGTLEPDLAFLDLQMPGASGFDVVHALGGASAPVVVIVIEAGAIDYSVEAGQRSPAAQGRGMCQEPAHNGPRTPPHHLARITSLATSAEAASSLETVDRSKADCAFLSTGEVVALQAEREMVWTVTARKPLLATESLRALERRLGEPLFQRIHRNAIVNMNHVRRMIALSSQCWLVALSKGMQFVAGKRQAHSIPHTSAADESAGSAAHTR